MKLNWHPWEEEPDNCFGLMEEQEEDRKPANSLPVLERLDQLDQRLSEESRDLSASHPNDLVLRKVEPQDACNCKSSSSTSEDVRQKGSLIERLAMLEDQVLQISLETYAANASKSSYSGAENLGNIKSPLDAAVIDEEREDAAAISLENKNLSPLKAQKMCRVSKPKGRREGKGSLLWRREWFGCFQS